MTPPVIGRYFGLQESSDIDALLACFTRDAVVTDDGNTMKGIDAIRQWKKGPASAFEFTATMGDETVDGDGTYVVTATLEGNFPVSPTDLRYRFTLRGDQISQLIIAP